MTIVRSPPAGGRSSSGGVVGALAAAAAAGAGVGAPAAAASRSAPTTSTTMRADAAVAGLVRRPERGEARTEIDRDRPAAPRRRGCPGAMSVDGVARQRRVERVGLEADEQPRCLPARRCAASAARRRASRASALPSGSTRAATRGTRMSPTRISRDGLRSSRRVPSDRRQRAADEIDRHVPRRARRAPARAGSEISRPRDRGERLLRREHDRLRARR